MNAPEPFLLPCVGDWYLLPSGRTVSVRKIDGIGFQTELTVRYVDEHGAMSTGDFYVSITYICKGRRIGHD